MLTWRVFAHGDIHEQIEALNFQLTKEPNNAALILRRGELRRVHCEFTNALTDLDLAARLDPKLDAVDLVRGRVYVELKRPELAINSLTRFLARHTNNAIAYIERAHAFEQLGQGLAATDDLTQAIARAPEAGPDLYLERARVLRDAGPEHYPRALDGLAEALRKLGLLVTIELAAMELELDLKRYDAALGRLDRIAARSVRKESWHVRRAEILARAGRPTEARRAWEQARTACAALPESMQRTRAGQQLVARIHSELAKIEGNSEP